MEITNVAVIFVRVHEDRPSEIFRYPWSDISDIVVMNQRSSGTYYGFSSGHTYGYGFNGPRMYTGWNTGHQVGDLCFMNRNGQTVLKFMGLNDPHGVKRLADAARKSRR
jgi:hypothetical protein